MKFQITLKDPDGFSNSIRQAVEESLAKLPLEGEELESAIELRTKVVEDFLEKWVNYGEYITIEFDKKSGTATVLTRK